MYLVEVGVFDEEDSTTMIDSHMVLVSGCDEKDAKLRAYDFAKENISTVQSELFDIVNDIEIVSHADYR